MSDLKLLDGIRVVDLGIGMAPALAAKYLAEAGAHVVRVEPEGGDPFYDQYPAYEVWRRGCECNSDARRDRSKLNELIAAADVCINGGEDYPGLARRHDSEAIAMANPRLVLLDISGHPHGSEDAHSPSNEILAQARSGICYAQFSDRPLFMSFHPANYGAALQGLCALLAALYERESTGRGQIVRTSLFEGALTWAGLFYGDFERPTPPCYVNSKDTTPLIFRCADGVDIHIVIGGRGSKYKFYQILGIDDPSVSPDSLDLPHPSRGSRNFYGDIDLLAPYIAKRDSHELLEALWSAGLPAELVLPPGECWDFPQATHNGVIVRDEDGTRHVGNPIIAKSVTATHRRASSTPVPLQELRVLDFGAFLAGPKAPGVLADLGADVVKVEPPAGDPARGTLRGFMTGNRGKRGIVIDLKTSEGLAVALDLSAKADIVCNNFRAGVSARLGIDPESLHALKSDLIVLESPAYGSSGPLAQRAGFDLVMQSVCGHEMRAGGEGNAPLYNGTAMVDFAGGMLGAVGLLSALLYRARTGKGVALDAPLFNAGIFLLSELIQRPDGTFEGGELVNRRRTGFRPGEAMYEARGGWLAISVPNDRAAAALERILDLTGKLPSDVRSWGDRESDAIAAAILQRSVAELSATLAKAGVWNEKCRTDAENEVLDSQSARVSWHPTLGRIREVGQLFSFSIERTKNERPIHDLGEHANEIFSEWQ
jgi:crotonobetainyl-CoA:carnitine CoA-transferase CaiB-like acyl-CoA transferase